MGIPNLGFLYYKDYYRDEENNYKMEDEKIIKSKNEQILNQKLNEQLFKAYDNKYLKNISNSTLCFKTTYPGLLVGSGYNHGIENKNEFKIGFYFDYTTGLPEIPASSIKGLLRSPFKGEHYDYLKYILKDELELDISDNFIIQLEKAVFDGEEKDDKGNYVNLPMRERDIFFNGIIDYVETKKYLGDTPFLGDDYITPHGNGLTEPKPIKFLKVMPNVVFRLRFRLSNKLLTIDEKLKLFRRIIIDLGLGAKTNVGYGRFQEDYKLINTQL